MSDFKPCLFQFVTEAATSPLFPGFTLGEKWEGFDEVWIDMPTMLLLNVPGTGEMQYEFKPGPDGYTLYKLKGFGTRIPNEPNPVPVETLGRGAAAVLQASGVDLSSLRDLGRSDRVGKILEAYNDRCNLSDEDVTDLLADIMWFCNESEIEFDPQLDRARRHFRSESKEEQL